MSRSNVRARTVRGVVSELFESYGNSASGPESKRYTVWHPTESLRHRGQDQERRRNLQRVAACLFTTTNPKRVLHASAARIHLLCLRKRLSKGNNRFCSSIYIYAYTHCTHAHKAERPSRWTTTPAAIGRYTRALLADSGDSTFVLTCAAAYLKLGKCVAFSALRLRVLTRGEDAGRDCARLLAAEPKGVKARFRCMQTRVDAVLTFRAKVSTAALSVEVEDQLTAADRCSASPSGRSCKRCSKG
jgi:hypothetical protein